MLMAASEVVENIGKTGTVVPVSERQARPLAALPPEERADASATVANATRTTSDGRQYPATRRTSSPTTPEEEEAAAQNGGRSTGEGAPLTHPPAHAASHAPQPP